MPDKKRCTRCGGGHLRQDKCPAKEVICHNCHKKGHYSQQCFHRENPPKSDVADIREEDEEEDLDGIFLDMVSTGGQKSNWKTQLTLQDKSDDFKIDTGADATIISENTFRSLKGVKLTKAKKRLCGPSQQSLPTLKHFTGKITRKEQSVCSTIYVVKGLKTNLLGLPAITALNIVARVDTIDKGFIESQKEIVLHKYPDLFRGLGNLGEAYTFKLRADAKVHALFTARKIPLPLRD